MNFALMMTGIGEVNALPSIVRGITTVRKVEQTAQTVQKVEQFSETVRRAALTVQKVEQTAETVERAALTVQKVERAAQTVQKVEKSAEEIKKANLIVKESKWDYFFGRVKSSPQNQARSLQNVKDLETLGIKEAECGRAKLLNLLKQGESLPETARHTSEFGVTITRTIKVGDIGVIEAKYFYPGGNLSASPEISTIIPKIFKK